MRIDAKQRVRKLFRLRTILLMVMLSVLLLPLGSLYFFRFYENVLVQKTEVELITQSAVFSSLYREFIGHNNPQDNGVYTPVEPQLDLSKQKILPRRPQARLVLSSFEDTDLSPAQIAGERMQNILLSTQKVTLAGMRILDNQGLVVAGRSEIGMSLADIPEVQQALKGEYAAVLRERISDEPPPSIASLSRGTGIRVFTAFPIIDQGQVYGVVYLSRTPQNILKHLYSIKEKVILLSLVLLGLTGLIVLFISSRLSRPIRELIEQTQKVTSGESETVEVLKQPGTYELSKLSNSFAKMSQTLHERSQYIQQFASHVSHEFKTPLTSMQGSLELLQEHGDDMPKEQHQRFINNLQDDTERLKRLVNRLLEQARADSLQGSAESTNLLDCMKAIESRYADENIQFNYSGLELDKQVSIGKSSLQSVISNLVDNSLQHGATEIDIDSSISATDKNRIAISFHDNGKGISEANRNRIFTPFFTTKRETGGTGLGLGIIESILKASNGTIENHEVATSDQSTEISNNNSGAKFVINIGLVH
ncbi:HAMP domain-containing sensor histidine kinase [uncultured Cocleimonas sp.]|uniref:sensor histidine kinase n=1 Tax=uncultured Cocleimonas sp. TaxID=1051587 RepID=UPI0026128643|nr:HAMP domain-containing sensor histidine kinase [uncultured Cocleimonas sp.]